MTDKEFYRKRELIKEEWKQLIYNNELQNYDISNIGKIRNHTTGKEYKLSKTSGMKNCYEFINITLNDKSRLNIGIHRLMGIMFIPIPVKYLKKKINLNKLVIDHIDNCKYHNIIENLQWLTNSENIKKSRINVKIRDLLITDETVHKICKDLEKGKTIYELSKKYKISELLIHDIRYNIRYKDISKNYNFPKKQLDDESVKYICELLQKGYSSSKINKEYGYSISTITNILAGVSWKYISKNYNFPNKRGIKEETVHEICKLLQEGKSVKEVSEKLNVTKSTVKHIKNHETYVDITKNYIFDHSNFRIDDSVVDNICKDISDKKYTNKEIADRNNVSTSFVKSIKSRKSRTDISNKYLW